MTAPIDAASHPAAEVEGDEPRRLCAALGVSFPLILAGMGGVAGPELVASVSNVGGAGTLGLYKAPSERITQLLARTEELTDATYGVNFVPEVLDEPALSDRIDAVLAASRQDVFVSFFGLPPVAAARAVRRSGRRLVVQVGSADQAAAAVALGADALILQGIEAGGHLLGATPIQSLLSAVRRMLPDVPLAAAGGIATGAAFARLAAHGADGVCCGTLFVPTAESRAHELYKRSILAAQASDTAITDIFHIGWPGRRHRVIVTPRVRRGRGAATEFIARTRVYGSAQLIPRYSAAVPTVDTTGDVHEMALYCGTSCGDVCEPMPASAAFARFVEQYRSTRPASANMLMRSHIPNPTGAPWTSASSA